MAIAESFSFFGLSLFIFISGYSLMIKKPSFNSLGELRKYLVKRILRIYPLYWIVLFILLIFDGLPRSDILTIIINISGFQILFYPGIIQYSFYWFVSAIIVFYLLFPVILYGAHRIGKQFELSVFLVSFIIFIGLLSINLVFGTIDLAIFMYYWLFISGIVIGNRIRISEIKRSQAIIAGIEMASGIFLIGLLRIFIFPGGALHLTDPFVLMAIFLAMGISIVIAIQLTNLIKRFVRGKVALLVTIIATSTYSIYLFTGPVLGGVTALVTGYGVTVTNIVIIVIGIPLALIISIFFQKMVDRLFKSVLRS